jgi:hypothetical protein
MPTVLPPDKPHRPGRAGFALKAAMLVSVLLLGALVQVTAQIYFAAPASALHYAAMLPVAR